MMHLRPKKAFKPNPIPTLPLNACLAKTWRQKDGTIRPGRTVLEHCQIVGRVAKTLLERMPCSLRNKHFPPGSELIVACHDIGKVCPTFQHKIYNSMSDKTSDACKTAQALNPKKLDEIKLWGGHATLSQLTLEAFIDDEDSSIPLIAGKHHGFAADAADESLDECFGGAPWHALRIDLIEELKAYFDCDFPEGITKANPTQSKLLAGLTSVADWIGSGEWFDDPSGPWEPLIDKAVDFAGYIAPTLAPNMAFEALFGFTPHDNQSAFIANATTPGVYILEAPMGMGKTEAALAAAYQLLQQGNATGIYFALPTQLTSDKIHERFTAFLSKALTADSHHHHPILAHGNAWLSAPWGEDAAPGGAWFQKGKRGILAPFAVGTIDQALMAVLHVKHGFVRTFGLTGKVVILDEVHSYDAYTGTALKELVDVLREMECTVILLSATLTQARTAELLGDDMRHDAESVSAEPTAAAYPRMTGTAYHNGQRINEAMAIHAKQSYAVKTVANDDAAFEEALARAEGGAQVLWIENTVGEAQAAYQRCAAHAAGSGIAVGLLHARFTRAHRAANEDAWVAQYGKSGWDTRGAHGRILVGTQVVEQSLDIDADFLITRMAPTDMLLQRIGRCWRHADTPRANASCGGSEVWILAPDINEAIASPNTAFGNSARVYAPYVLIRSLEVWQANRRLTVPDDIRTLMEATYAVRAEEGKMRTCLERLNNKKQSLHSMARQGFSEFGVGAPDDRVQTRHSDMETVDVLLLKVIEQNVAHNGARGAWLTFLDGKRHFYPTNGKALAYPARCKMAARLQKHMVTVARHIAPKPVARKHLSALVDFVYLGHQDEAAIRVAIVYADDTLCDMHGHADINDDYALRYTARLGYQATKK